MLDPQQMAIATHPLTGILTVRARAGSGKTRTIRARVDHALETRRAEGKRWSRILVLAFNTKVKDELNDHFDRDLSDEDRKRVHAKTFHQAALGLIHANRALLPLKQTGDLVILKETTYSKEIAEYQDPEYGILGNELASFVLKAGIQAEAKDTRLDLLLEADPRMKRLMERVAISPDFGVADVEKLFTKLRKQRFEQGRLLFADFLPLANSLPPGSYSRPGYVDVLVDEVQDLSAGQRALAWKFLEHAKSFSALGDDSQCIYSFNGAKASIFKDIRTENPEHQVVEMTMSRTYRCCRSVIDVANHVLSNCLGVGGLMMGGNGKDGDVNVVFDYDGLVPWVQERIREVGIENVAILFRTYAQTPVLQQRLVEAGIPFSLAGGGLFDLPEVKHLLAHTRVATQPRFSEEDWQAVVNSYHNMGFRTAASALAENSEEPWEVSASALKLPSHRRKAWAELQENIRRLRRLGNSSPRNSSDLWAPYREVAESLAPHWATWRDFEKTAEAVSSFQVWLFGFPPGSRVNDLVAAAKIVEDAQALVSEDESKAVKVMTVHRAKGLEWDSVALWDVASGRFPMVSAPQFPVDNEEELRLVYVAATRAKNNLLVVSKSFDTATKVEWLKPWTEALAGLQQAVA